VVIEVRDAVRDDLAAVVDVAGIVDPPDEGADVDVSYYEHLVDHGRLVIAEAGGIVLGYSGVLAVDGARHLSDLFVHPDAHGQGIGSAVLDATWDAGTDAVPRQTFSSLHPAALPLYVRAGMIPRWPLLYLRGDPASLPDSPLRVRDGDAAEISELERDWIGWDRTSDHSYWGSRPGARSVVVTEAGTPVAAGCIGRTRARHTLTHLSAVDRSYLPSAVAALGPLCGSDLLVTVAGENPVLPMLVGLGWRIVDRDIYCASGPDLWDATAVLPHAGFL
jgi:GNAT superfamily N-acetyltransferase